MMVSDMLSERFKSEKKFLSNMIIKLVGENQQLLRENRQFREQMRSVQYPQRYMKLPLEEMEMDNEIKTKKPLNVKYQQTELSVSRPHECHLAKHQDCLKNVISHHGMLCCPSVLTSDSARCHHHLNNAASGDCLEHELTNYQKTHLQCWEKKMEEKKGNFFKEQLHMLEMRAALIEQEKHIERLQMKINHLQNELKNSEVHATLQVDDLKDYHGSWMCEIDVDHLGSQMNRTGKKSYVYIWQTSDIKKPGDDTGNEQKKHAYFEKLSKEWLEKIKKEDSKAAKENLLRWLQESMDRVKQKGSEALRKSLEEWLTESSNNLEKECSGASIQDVREWLQVSTSHLKEEGPDTFHLSVEEWFEASIKSIQDLMEANCPKKYIKIGWLQESLENLKARGSKSSRKNVHQWLQESIKSLKQKTPELSQKSLEEWLSESVTNLKDVGPETFRQDVTLWLETSLKNLQEDEPEASCLSVQEWFEQSLNILQEEESKRKVQVLSTKPSMKPPLRNAFGAPGTSYLRVEDLGIVKKQEKAKLNVSKWLEASLKSVTDGGPYASGQNVQEWLEESLKNLDKNYPEESQEDMRKWLEAAIKKFRDGDPEVTGQNLEDFLIASITKIVDEGPKTYDFSVNEWLEQSIKNANEAASRIRVQKWLEASMKTLEDAGNAQSPQSLPQWLETVMQKLDETCPETSKRDVEQWLQAALMDQQQNPDAPEVSLQEWLKACTQRFREEGPKEPIADVEKWLEDVKHTLRDEASRRNVEEWISETLEYLQQNPEAPKEDLNNWLENALSNLREICPEEAQEDVKRWLETTIEISQEVPRNDMESFLMTSMGNIRRRSRAASRDNNMDWLKVPEWSKSNRDSLDKIKRNLTRRRLSSVTEDMYTNYEQEEFSEPQPITFQPEKTLMTRIKKIISYYRNRPSQFFKHLSWILIPVMLAVLAYKYSQECCITCLFRRGLRPH